MSDIETAKLKEILHILGNDPNGLNWPTRNQIERAVFTIAAATASNVGFVLTGVSNAAREDFHARGSSMGDREQNILTLTFAIQDNLGLLSSGDPYIVSTNGDVTLEGRAEVFEALKTQIEALCKLAS